MIQPRFRIGFQPIVIGTVAVAAGAIVLALAGRVSTPGGRTSEPARPASVGGGEPRSEGGAVRRSCAHCGVVESIRVVEVRGDLGADNQVGRGRGNAVATAVGAYSGHDAGAKRVAYRVTVRMEDGSYRTLSQAGPPAVAIGAEVRVVDGVVTPRARDERKTL